MSAYRIRPVKYDNRFIHFCTSLHAEVHRPYKRIVTGTNILQIYEHSIQIFQHKSIRFAVSPIEAEDGQVCFSVMKSFPFNHIVLCLTTNSMLRAEKGFEFKLFGFVYQAGGMLQIPVY